MYKLHDNHSFTQMAISFFDRRYGKLDGGFQPLTFLVHKEVRCNDQWQQLRILYKVVTLLHFNQVENAVLGRSLCYFNALSTY